MAKMIFLLTSCQPKCPYNVIYHADHFQRETTSIHTDPHPLNLAHSKSDIWSLIREQNQLQKIHCIAFFAYDLTS